MVSYQYGLYWTFIPTSLSGNSYILTITDYFTKFVEAVSLPDKSAHGVAASLFKV
jgi:hypothetical protein